MTATRYVINATKIVLEKKEKEYPKTYEECCEVLSIAPYYNLRYHTYEHGFGEFTTSNKLCSLQDKLNILGKLLICRDAYWKLAGDWKPDWAMYSGPKHCIICSDNQIKWQDKSFVTESKVLAFPTKEMRDAFYENFKELIEQCKELL